MSWIVEACVIVVTLTFLGVAIMTIRALGRFAKIADLVTEQTGAFRTLVEDATRTSAEVRQLVDSLESVTESFAGAASKLGRVGDRAASMSSVVLDQVEPPVLKAVALARGVRAGAEVLASHFMKSRSHNDR
jgi:hypothetical protein